MNILINASNIKLGGGVQVAHSIFNSIYETIDSNLYNFYFVASKKVYESLSLEKTTLNERLVLIKYSQKLNVKNIATGKDVFLDNLTKEKNIAKVFSVFGPCYWRPSKPHLVGYAKPQYVYPESPYFSRLSLKSWIILVLKKYFHLRDFKKNADIIVTENRDVTKRISKLLDIQGYTVSNTANNVFSKYNFDNNLESETFRLLTITAHYPHKNLDIIDSVIDRLRNLYPNFLFLFTISLTKDQIRVKKRNLKFISFLGEVRIQELPNLYKNSDAMFLPTLLECFSASYAEAMKTKTLILTSKLPFAKSICKDAAYYFDPLNPEEIAKVIYESYKNKEASQLMLSKGTELFNQLETPNSRFFKYLEILKKM